MRKWLGISRLTLDDFLDFFTPSKIKFPIFLQSVLNKVASVLKELKGPNGEPILVILDPFTNYAKAHNKLAALTECVYRNNPKSNDLYTRYYLTALRTYPLELS